MPDNENAKRELALLRLGIVEARMQLSGLEGAMTATALRADGDESLRLARANEQLAAAAVRARQEADVAALRLEEMTRVAEHDALTGLPNRVLLLDRLAHAIKLARRRRARIALLFVDLNQFKRVNDSLGHATGDRVLRHAARAITAAVRDEDTVSRHGGDEFLVLLSEIGERDDARVVAEKILALLGAPTRVGEQVLSLTASIGISVYPEDGGSAQALIDHADAAMYVAKRQVLGGYAFHGDMDLAATSPPSDNAFAVAGQELQQLREANKQLLVSVVEAQTLQAVAEHAHRRQTEFLALLAHELSDPLWPIHTAAAVLAHASLADLPKIRATLERQVGHMTRLVGDLLEMGRVRTGKLRIELASIDLETVIDGVVETCRRSMEVRLQTFTVQLPVESLAMIGDSVRLTQVLSNLLLNAAKYTPECGAIHLAVAATPDELRITVTDNGIGVSATALPEVFEPFIQDPHAVGFNGRGLGIGLTVVRELVHAHGGTVVLESAGIGCGCTARVTLPRGGGLPRVD